MATKLSKEDTKRLAELGLPTKSAEDAKKALLKILKDNEITDADDEEISVLIDMAEAFGPAENEGENEDEDDEESDSEGDDEEGEEEEEEEEESDDEEEEEEEEAPAPAPKAKGKKAAKMPKPDDEEDLDEAAEEAEEKPAPKKGKAAPAPAPAPAKKGDNTKGTKAAPAPAADKKAPKKAAPAAVEAATRSRGERFDNENPAHAKLLKPLFKRFPDGQYSHKMGKDGISIRLNDTETTNRTIIVYNGLRVVEGELKGMMNFNALRLGGKDSEGKHNGEKLIRKTFEDEDDLLDRLVMEDTLPKIKQATVEEVIMMVDKLGDDMETKLKKLDTKLNKNKATLEKNMGTTTKKDKGADAKGGKKGKVVEDEETDEEETPAPAPKGKKAAKPAPEPEPEDEDEDDEEEAPAPAPKKAAKKDDGKKAAPAPAKSAKKK